jgi:hypothetical protein
MACVLLRGLPEDELAKPEKPLGGLGDTSRELDTDCDGKKGH